MYRELLEQFEQLALECSQEELDTVASAVICGLEKTAMPGLVKDILKGTAIGVGGGAALGVGISSIDNAKHKEERSDSAALKSNITAGSILGYIGGNVGASQGLQHGIKKMYAPPKPEKPAKPVKPEPPKGDYRTIGKNMAKQRAAIQDALKTMKIDPQVLQDILKYDPNLKMLSAAAL